MRTGAARAPKRLIVNADDFGLSEGINQGIAEAVEEGGIKSASILACGDAFDHAVAIAGEHPDLDIGVHLCLEGERPVLPADEIPSLVGPDGHFLSRPALLQRLLVTRRINLEEVRKELLAQIGMCTEAGLRLSHFDGHGHVHVYPRIVDVVVRIATEVGLRSCRLPAESLFFFGRDFRPRSYLNKAIVSAFSWMARPKLRAAGIVTPDVFMGMVYGGRLSPALIRHLLEALPPVGVVEIMSHPGRFNPEELASYLHWNYAWEDELEALKSLRDQLQEVGPVDLISFEELKKVSEQSEKMGEYWDQQVIGWEQTSYSSHHASPSPVGPIETLAGLLRGHIRDRQDSCLRHLRDRVADKVVVEMGCASGSTCLALLEMGARRVIGLDISNKAVESARAQARERGFDASRAAFHQYAAGDPLPFDAEIDIATGLGIWEYVAPGLLLDFVKDTSPKDIFFSFDERKLNLQKLLHFVYRNYKGIPYYKMYSQSEILGLLADLEFGDLRTFREGKNTFISSFS